MERIRREQRDLIEHLREEKREKMILLEQIEAGLKRVENEQQKLNRQEVRNAILIEQIVANLPSA